MSYQSMFEDAPWHIKSDSTETLFQSSRRYPSQPPPAAFQFSAYPHEVYPPFSHLPVFAMPTTTHNPHFDEGMFPNEGDANYSEGEEVSPINHAKSAAIDIHPTNTHWRGQDSIHSLLESPHEGRHKNMGKVAINMDTNLSSSTDDLLKLAGGPLQRFNFPSYEESPPIESMLHFSQMSDDDRSPLTDRKFRETRVYDMKKLHSADDENEYSQIVGGMQNIRLASNPPLPEDRASSSSNQPVCRYFASGFCSRGERCNFLHIEHSFSSNGAIMHKTRFNKSGRVPLPASRYANLTIEECVGDIASMCLDQHGCRYLQRQLDSCDPNIVTLIFNEAIDHMVELMSDPFGNYLCQKLIEHISEEQRIEIVKSVASDLVQISKNMHGTRAVQKLVEHTSTPEENKIIRKALKGSVVALIQDLNGNHVIQKCLHKMEPNDNQFIYDAVAQHCVHVSTHRHGCCVMQRCIDHATYDQKLQLVAEIKKTALTLVQDAFGNYVVQYALDLNIPGLASDLIFQLQTKLHQLAKQKFSSNVVEKCLKSGDAICVIRVLRELLGEDPDPNITPVPTMNPELIQQKLIDLLQDSYGNYVIQTCLSEGAACAPAEYTRMANLLRPYVHHLRSAPYIKRIHNLLNLPTSVKANPKEKERINSLIYLPHQECPPNYQR